jgi:5-methylcytosine-specific restriction protein A
MPGPWGHLYDTLRWRRLRALYLREHPDCVMCEEHGWEVPATVVDHKRPHHGDTRLFFDPSNLQSLCKPHHDSNKARQEHRGVLPGCNENGDPIDPKHPWNRARKAT